MHDLIEQSVVVRRGKGGRLQEADIALNDREDIVEFVRDARGHAADDFHFLRLPQLRLHFQLLGNVLDDDEQAGHTPDLERFGGHR